MPDLVGVEVTAEKVSEEIFPQVPSPVAQQARRCHLSPAHHGAEAVAGSFQARRALAGGAVILWAVLPTVDPVVQGVVSSPHAVEDCTGSEHIPPGGEGQLDRVDPCVADNPDVGSIRAARKDAGGGPLHCVDSIAADEIVAENSTCEIEQAVGAQPGTVLVGPAVEFHVAHDLVAAVGHSIPIGVFQAPEIGGGDDIERSLVPECALRHDHLVSEYGALVVDSIPVGVLQHSHEAGLLLEQFGLLEVLSITL